MAVSARFEFSNKDRCIHFYSKNKKLINDNYVCYDRKFTYVSFESCNIDFIIKTLNFYKETLIVYITESTSDYMNHNITKMIYKNGKIEESDYLEELYNKAQTQDDYLELINYNRKYYELTPEKYKNDSEFMLKIFDNSFTYEFYSCDEFNTNDMLCDKEFLIKIVEKYNKKLYDDTSFDNDEKIIKMFDYCNLPDKLFEDKSFLNKALNINYEKYFRYLDIDYQKTKIKENIELLNYANKDIFKDEEFLDKINFNNYFVESYKKSYHIPSNILPYLNKNRFFEILKIDFLNNNFNDNLLEIYNINKNLYNGSYYDDENELLNVDYKCDDINNIEFYFKRMLNFNNNLLISYPIFFKDYDNDEYRIIYKYNKFLIYLYILPDKDVEEILNLYKKFVLNYFNLVSSDDLQLFKRQILKLLDKYDNNDKDYLFKQLTCKEMLLCQILSMTNIVNDKDFIYELLIRYYDYYKQENEKTIDYLLYVQENINSFSELNSGIINIDKYKVLLNYKNYEFLVKINDQKDEIKSNMKMNEVKLNSIITLASDDLLNDLDAMNEIIERYLEYILPF